MLAEKLGVSTASVSDEGMTEKLRAKMMGGKSIGSFQKVSRHNPRLIHGLLRITQSRALGQARGDAVCSVARGESRGPLHETDRQ